MTLSRTSSITVDISAKEKLDRLVFVKKIKNLFEEKMNICNRNANHLTNNSGTFEPKLKHAIFIARVRTAIAIYRENNQHKIYTAKRAPILEDLLHKLNECIINNDEKSWFDNIKLLKESVMKYASRETYSVFHKPRVYGLDTLLNKFVLEKQNSSQKNASETVGIESFKIKCHRYQ